MAEKVAITVGDVVLEAELSDTDTARAVLDALPLEVTFSTWGDEIYFVIPVDRGLDETATTRVGVGDIGYWPTGNALAIFFGPTPMSTSDEPVPASEVNVVGRVLGDATALRRVMSEGKVRVEKIKT
jgi:hypothetical protein